MDNVNELTRKIILVNTSGEEIRGFDKASDVAKYLSCEVRRVYTVLKEAPLQARFKGHVVAHSAALSEILDEVTVETIKQYVKSHIRATNPPVIIYDKNGKYVASKDTVADVALYLNKPQPNIHRAKKPENAHYLVNNHYVRELSTVLDDNGNVRLQLSKNEMVDPTRVISLYKATGELIKTFDTPKELSSEIDVDVTQINKMNLRGELIVKDIENFYFVKRGFDTSVKPVVNPKSRTIKLWKVSEIETGKIVINTTSVNEVAEYLSVTTTLIYNCVKNFRPIAGSFRIHQTEIPNLKIES